VVNPLAATTGGVAEDETVAEAGPGARNNDTGPSEKGENAGMEGGEAAGKEAVAPAATAGNVGEC